MKEIEKIKKKHTVSRIREIGRLFNNRNTIYNLNTSIIDNNEYMVKLNQMKLNICKQNYKYLDFHYINKDKKIEIAYLFPHNNVTGGLKILIEQSNYLYDKGYNISIYSHFPKPNWMDIKSKYIKVPPDIKLYKAINKEDIVIATTWDLIIEAIKSQAPIKYYICQGDVGIFEYDNLEPVVRNAVYTAYQLPVKILTISSIMKRKLEELFNRKSIIIPNAIDNKVFYPDDNKELNKEDDDDDIEVLIVGNDYLEFKGHKDIVKALYILKREGYNFRIKWLMGGYPTKDYTSTRLNLQYHIKPTQKEIGRIYRTSDMFISGSYYEAFSLPPLEAMACGIPTITADNKGIDEYAIDGKNCLKYKKGDCDDLKDRIKTLINSTKLKNTLVKNGIETAKSYYWDRSISKLEEVFINDINNYKLAVLEY